jgi:branched-chain amino acid transport system permease protein
VSLQIVFAAVVGGMYSLLGPTVGTAITITLAEYLRVAFGVKFLGMADTIYGLALILIIIFLPQGLYGSLRALRLRRPAPAAARR